jgi:hypothetical protein
MKLWLAECLVLHALLVGACGYCENGESCISDDECVSSVCSWGGIEHPQQISARPMSKSSMSQVERLQRPTIQARQVHMVHLDLVVQHGLVGVAEKTRWHCGSASMVQSA